MKDKHCCKSFKNFIKKFYWMTLDKKYIMPYTYVDGIKYRVNHCPSCGADVRDIELNKI